jgi:hypothetical protein
MPIIRQFICWFASIDWTPEAITAAGTIALAFLTLVLAVGTLFLWLATRRLVRGTDKTAKAQLRAYVSIKPSGLRKISPTENFHFSFVQLNGGQTPAYSLSQDGELLLVDHPLPENFPFPTLTRTRGSKTMMPPNIPFTGHLVATRQFTKNEIIEILEGRATGARRLYIFGQIDCIDAFKKAHWTRYCFSFPGWNDAIDLAKRNEWGVIANILNNPGFALNFEIASQHNVTDDG